MDGLKEGFLSLLIQIGLCALIVGIRQFYWMIKRLFNRPIIGGKVKLSLLKQNDYVYFNDQLLQFSHIARVNECLNPINPPFESNKTSGNELAFFDENGVGYMYYHASSLRNCKFIYGKEGLKWAINKEYREHAKEIVKNRE